jgi:hypothetical protein
MIDQAAADRGGGKKEERKKSEAPQHDTVLPLGSQPRFHAAQTPNLRNWVSDCGPREFAPDAKRACKRRRVHMSARSAAEGRRRALGFGAGAIAVSLGGIGYAWWMSKKHELVAKVCA